MSLYKSRSEEEGHGRLTIREVEMYDVRGEYFDKRWQSCDISTLIVMHRYFRESKTGKVMEGYSYYITNQSLTTLNKEKMAEELFEAIIGHWTVENQHQIRDVTFNEDKIRSKDRLLNRVMACLRTVGIEIVRSSKTNNFKAQIEKFNDKPKYFERFLKNIGFV